MTPKNDPSTPVQLSDERLRAMRQEVRRRLAAKRRRRARLVAPDPPPRYDEVFFQGLAWLDRF
ncbi:MAG: hypothetical protein ACOC92_02120 [bacterium]